MGQKRGHDSKAQALQTKKRKKSTKADASEDDSNAFVGVEDLNWKEVALPDRMEDATGFFGLEEIDGVDIIRGQGGGEVQFKVCIPKLWSIPLDANLWCYLIRPSQEGPGNQF